MFSLEIENKRKIFPYSFTPTQHQTGGSAQQGRKKKLNIGKEKIKLSLFTDDVTVYVESPKKPTKPLLQLINKFSKFTGYKNNVQNLYRLVMNNTKMAFRRQLTLASKRVKTQE